MSLQTFFQPRSVAVIGASRERGKVGNEVLRNLRAGGFRGAIYPVNARAAEIEGLPCFPDVGALPEGPDLALIVVPAAAVPEVVSACGAKGIKTAIIISAGFKEVGPEGARLEQDVVSRARQQGMRIIGPNCLGVIVHGAQLNASFGSVMPQAGGIGYLSQSGALLAAILDVATANQIGFSALVSIGNKADVDELEVMRALADMPPTRVIAGYLESVNDGNAFVREAEQISRHKPILLLKAGGTTAGARAASSHTGSLAGGEMVYEVAFERAGVIRCDSLKTQFDLAFAFASQPLPAGPNVAIVTNAGGPGIMAADAVERQNLELAELAPVTVARLRDRLPPAANVHNPIDMLGDARADRYEFTVRTALEDPNVHALVVLLTPQAMTECTQSGQALVRAARERPDKPVFACFLGAERVREAIQTLREARIPTYDCPESAIRTIQAMAGYRLWQNRPPRVVKMFPVNRHRVERIVERHLRRGLFEIGEMESKEMLEAYGFVTPQGALATTAEQAGSIAQQIGFPVVMKIWSPDIIHKSDVGGVRLGLHSAQEVMDAFDLMMFRVPRKAPEAQILGVLVQEMCGKGQEVILGMSRDPRFGPLMMFGMGGIFVEVLKDVTFYLAPLTAEEARQMLVSTRTYQILKGVRGREGVDIDAIAEALQRLSQLVTEFPAIKEMDINPLVVGPPGSTPIAVDARITLESPAR